MEVAQYGDTEIPASELKSTIEKLKQCDKENMKSKMEEDFEVSCTINHFKTKSNAVLLLEYKKRI